MRLTRLLAGLAAGLALLASAPADARSWKLAVTDVEGLERLQTEWGPFKAELERVTGETFEFFPVSSRTAAAEALRAESVDFVITGPAEYVVINTLTKATPLVGLGRPDYYCAVIVRADAGITSMADLKGKKVAFGDIGSTSNMLCPMQLMADYGVNPQTDIERVHTSRNIAHESLKKGDVAAIGINYTSWVRSARDKDTSVPYGFFKALARSGDLPNDMIMVGAHVPAEAAAKVREAILANKASIIANILVHEENQKYSGMDLVAIDDADYNIVRSMFRNAGFPQFDRFPGN